MFRRRTECALEVVMNALEVVAARCVVARAERNEVAIGAWNVAASAQAAEYMLGAEWYLMGEPGLVGE